MLIDGDLDIPQPENISHHLVVICIICRAGNSVLSPYFGIGIRYLKIGNSVSVFGIFPKSFR